MTSNAGRGKGRGVGTTRSGGRGHGNRDIIVSSTPQTSTTSRHGDNGDVVPSTPQASTRHGDNNIAQTQSSLEQVVNDVPTQEGGEGSGSGTKELDPNSLWFQHNTVTRAITSSIQEYYNDPWRNWTEVDQDTKDQWFRLFKRSFTWRPELDDVVRKSFDKKRAERLKGLHHWLTSSKLRKKGGVCPPWMHVDVHKELMARLEDGEFKKRSERAKKNKLSGSQNRVIHPGHVQGSISTQEVAERMAKDIGGLPLAADVYLKTHTKTDVTRGKVPCSAKPKKIIDDYEKKKTEYKDKGINKDPNEVYLEVVGGRKKGLIPGLGSSGDLWYQKSTNLAENSSTSYTPSLLSQLSSKLQQSQQEVNERLVELERQQVEVKKKAEELEKERIELEKQRIRSYQENQEERKKFLEYIEFAKLSVLEVRQCNSTPSIQPRDHQDPSSGGGGAPCAT